MGRYIRNFMPSEIAIGNFEKIEVFWGKQICHQNCSSIWKIEILVRSSSKTTKLIKRDNSEKYVSNDEDTYN